jgi:putative chitinase
MSLSLSADLLRRMWPSAPQALVDAIVTGGAATLAEHGVTSDLQLLHFMAQISHESDGGTIRRESMRYSANRIMQIFGVGHHSAAVTRAEAVKLAKLCRTDGGAALAERVYGLGNPGMAADLGNTEPGDGWNFRGGGLTQITGRAAYARASKLAGVDLVADPDRVSEPAIEFEIAAADFAWCSRGGLTCLQWADRDDIVNVTRALNGGTNGLASRREWLAKWRLAMRGATSTDTLEQGHDGCRVEAAQKRLAALGYYTGRIDGRYGQATEDAVAVFQGRNGLVRTGKLDSATWGALDTAPPKDVSDERAEAGPEAVADHPAARAASKTKTDAVTIGSGGVAAGLLSGLGDDPIETAQTAVAKAQAAKGVLGQLRDLAPSLVGWIGDHSGVVVALVAVAIAGILWARACGIEQSLVERFRRGIG